MMDAPMEDTDAARDEQELNMTEQKLLEAYRDRGASHFGKHPLERLKAFYINCDEEQLERRCQLAAEHNLHLPVLAWLPDPDPSLHEAAVHILAEITCFGCPGRGSHKWAMDVLQSLTDLGGVAPVLERFTPNASEHAIMDAANLLANLSLFSEQVSRIITKGTAPETAMRVIQNYQIEDLDACPAACGRLLATLTTNEENGCDLCYNRTMLSDLVLCLKNPVLECTRYIYDTLANLSLDRYMKGQMSKSPLDGSISVVQAMVLEIIKAFHKETAAIAAGSARRSHQSLVPLIRLIANVSVNVCSHKELVPVAAHLPDTLLMVNYTSESEKHDERAAAWHFFLTSVHALLSNTQCQELQLQLVRMIRNLTATPEICEKIVNCGGATALFLVIRDTDIEERDKLVHYWTAAAIASLARIPKLHPRLIQENGLRPLVGFAGAQDLSGEGCDLRTSLYAAKSLAELAKNDDNRAAIINEGGLVPLLVWARGFGNTEVQQTAVGVLERLGVDTASFGVENEDGPKPKDSQGIGVPEMVQLSKSGIIEVQLFAASEIANTVLDSEEIKKVLFSQGLKPLFRLLTSPQEEVQAEAARALLNMSGDHDGLEIDVLEAKIEERKAEMGCDGATHRQIMRDEQLGEYRELIVLKKNKIKTFVEHLENMFKTLKEGAPQIVQRRILTMIANLSIEEDLQKKMLSIENETGAGPIFHLMRQLQNSQYLPMQVHAARALFNISVNDQCMKKMVELCAVQICFDLILHNNAQVKRLVIGIIAHLASNAALRVDLALHPINGLSRLVTLASDKLPAIVQEQLARALAIMAIDDDNKRKIVELGGSMILIRWACSKRIPVQIQASKALCNLLEDKHERNEAVRVQLFQEGALQVLFNISQIGHTQSKLQVIRIMRSLRSYKDGAKWRHILNFFRDGGITPLCHLVTHPPNDSLKLQVRAEAAHELIALIQSVEQETSDLLDKVMPTLVPLIVIQPPGSRTHESTEEIQREVLCLFAKLIRQESHAVFVCRMVADCGAGKELQDLWNRVLVHLTSTSAVNSSVYCVQVKDEISKQALEKKRIEQTKAGHVRASARKPEGADPEEELEGFEKTAEERELDGPFAEMDELLDDETRKRLAEGKEAQETKEKMESAFEQMQDKLQAMEVKQLQQAGGLTEKKVFKVVVVGDAGVGKSSVIYRYIHQKTPPARIKPTLGCEYNSKRVYRDGRTILLQLYDIQGLESFRAAAPRSFFANAHGAIIMFDSHSSKAPSFFGAMEWKKTVDYHFAEGGRGPTSDQAGAPSILVANKSDVANNEKLPVVRSAAKMARCIQDNGFISWHESSARDGKGLKTDKATIFDSLIDVLLERDKQGCFEMSIETGDETVDITQPNRERGCKPNCKC